MKPNWFVGLPVSPQGWFDELRGALPACCRSFHPLDLHMTLAFFGPLKEERVPEVVAYLDHVQTEPIPVQLGSLLALPNKRRFSALSFALTTGLEQARTFMGCHRDPLIELVNARPDVREPLPHITIARPLKKATTPERRELLRWAQQVPPLTATLTLDRLALYTWSENRKERQFKIVWEKSFSLS